MAKRGGIVARIWTDTFAAHPRMDGRANMRGESEWAPISVTITDIFLILKRPSQGKN